MKLVHLRQSTPEWLEWRKGGVTASDISCLFGTNPYKTEWQLWAEKRGLRAEDSIEGNPYVRRGKMFEFMLRERVGEDRGVGLIPVCAEHGVKPVIRASLDGIDPSRRPWELKVLSPDNFESVLQDGINSEPVKRYTPQLQHQMLVTGAAEGFLIIGDIDDVGPVAKVKDYKVFVLPADPQFQEQISDKVEKFMDAVANGPEPAKDPKRDLFGPRSAHDAYEWTKVARKIRPLLEQKASLLEATKQIEAAIKREARPLLEVLGQNKSGQFSGLRATRVDKEGKIDWQKLVKSLGHDPTDEALVGPFRKAGSSHHQFTALQNAE